MGGEKNISFWFSASNNFNLRGVPLYNGRYNTYEIRSGFVAQCAHTPQLVVQFLFAKLDIQIQ